MRVCPPMAGRDLSLCRDSANETKGARPLIVKYHLSLCKDSNFFDTTIQKPHKCLKYSHKKTFDIYRSLLPKCCFAIFVIVAFSAEWGSSESGKGKNGIFTDRLNLFCRHASKI